MSNTPVVSVLLPVYNGESTIAEAVESLRLQTLKDLEIVVVDDGSEDQTPKILRRLARSEPRLRVSRQEHAGLVTALRHAAGEARATLLARMDADDRSHPKRLVRQVAWLHRRPELGAVGCLVRSFGDGPVQDGWQRYERWLNGRMTSEAIARDLFVESPLAHPSVTLRRSALSSVGGYRDLDGPEDYDLWLRLVGAGWKLAKVPAVLLEWRDHPARLTRTDPRYRPDAFIRLKAYHLSRGPLCKGRPLWIWGAGRYGRHLARALEAEGHEVDAFIDIDPKKIGRTRRGRPVLAPAALADQEHKDDLLVLVAVPVSGARALIRRKLNAMGHVELESYWCCA